MNSFDILASESTVPTRCSKGAQFSLVRPAPKGGFVDTEQIAGASKRQPRITRIGSAGIAQTLNS
jgi:hypothetical protein